MLAEMDRAGKNKMARLEAVSVALFEAWRVGANWGVAEAAAQCIEAGFDGVIVGFGLGDDEEEPDGC
jgi:hypothetical protein